MDHPRRHRAGGDLAAGLMLLSAQSMSVVKIAKVTFSSADRVRNVIHNFNAHNCNAHSFESFYLKCKAAVPGGFTLPERRGIAKSKPVDHGLPFSTWSPAKPTTSWSPREWLTTSATRVCVPRSARRASPFNA